MIFKDFMFNNRVPLMKSALNTYALRQETIAKNIANSDTPNYRPENVKFEELFHKEEVVLKGSTSENGHIPLGNVNNNPHSGEKGVRDIPEPEVFFSGENHVNVDREMSELAQNQIRFRLVSTMTKKYFSGLSSAIKGTNSQV